MAFNSLANLIVRNWFWIFVAVFTAGSGVGGWLFVSDSKMVCRQIAAPFLTAFIGFFVAVAIVDCAESLLKKIKASP